MNIPIQNSEFRFPDKPKKIPYFVFQISFYIY